MDRLMAKLEEFQAYIVQLKEASRVDWDRYSTDLMFKRGVERTLQLAIEAAIDIGNIMISLKKWRAPATNRDVFHVLVEQGVLAIELGQVIERLVGFRNILVHDYAKLDDSAIYSLLHGQFHGLEQFFATVKKRMSAAD